MKRIVRLTERDLTRIVKRVINEQNTEDTGGILEVFKKYAQILESLVPDLENYANEKNSNLFRVVVKRIEETVENINNHISNYDLDSLQNFMSRICNKDSDWFKPAKGLTKEVAGLYYRAYKETKGKVDGTNEIFKNKYEQVGKIYEAFKESQGMLCYIGQLEERGQSDSANDVIKKLDDLLSRFI